MHAGALPPMDAGHGFAWGSALMRLFWQLPFPEIIFGPSVISPQTRQSCCHLGVRGGEEPGRHQALPLFGGDLQREALDGKLQDEPPDRVSLPGDLAMPSASKVP